MTKKQQQPLSIGESVVEINGKWSDLSDSSESIKQSIYNTIALVRGKEDAISKFPHGAKSVSIDNFAIKGFTTSAPTRLSGKNRYGTATAISSGAYDHADTIILANGESFADALAGVPLAIRKDAPILLTKVDALPTETLDEIKRLGAKKAIIL